MPVKIGNSYVSEAAVNFAQSQSVEESGGNVLKDLAEKFPNLKFSIGTAPFSGNGLRNVAISPKILREMENNPDKRMEYEALLYDVANLNWNMNPTVKSSGVIIGDDGGLSMWSISKSGEDTKRVKVELDKNDKKSWWQKLLEKLQEKTETPAAKVELSNDDEKPKGKVGFNDGKRARQLAAAETKDEVRAILELLQNDLKECKEGVQNNMCTEDEVKKVEAMIERANKRLNEVDDEDPTPNFSPIDLII